MIKGSTPSNWLYAACLLMSVGLAGCNDDDAASPSAATSAATAAASMTGNAAPTISGTAATSVVVGNSYAFAPTVADANGDTVTFTIENKPAWAAFSTVTGKLTGTPTAADVGSFPNILIKGSDGKATATLAAFSITVTQIGVGSATLSWLPPTEYVDGTPLIDLAGYTVYYGNDASALTKTIKIDNASVNRYLVENLSSGTWYFSLKAYTTTGLESSFSAIASKKIS